MRSRRRPLIAGLVAAALLAVVVVVAISIPRLIGTTHRVSVIFPESTAGLVVGSDVLEAGAKVGSVSSLAPLPDNHAEVVIQVADANWPLHRGVTAGIRPRGLFGEKYVDVHDGPAGAPGYDPATPLHSTEADVPVALDRFLNSLDTNSRAAARTLLTDLGAGVAGAGPALNTAIAAARSNLDSLATTGKTLDQRDPDLDRILLGLDGVLGKLTQNDQLTQLTQLISNGQQTLNAVEAEQQAFSRQFNDSAAVLSDLNTAIDPSVGSLRDLVNLAPHLVSQLQGEAGLLAQLGQNVSDSVLASFEQSLPRGPTATGGALETPPGLPIFRVCLVTTPASCTGSGYHGLPPQPADYMDGGGAGELLTLAGFIGA